MKEIEEALGWVFLGNQYVLEIDKKDLEEIHAYKGRWHMYDIICGTFPKERYEALVNASPQAIDDLAAELMDAHQEHLDQIGLGFAGETILLDDLEFEDLMKRVKNKH